MPLTPSQLPRSYRDVCDEQVTIYNKGRSVEERKQIPDTSEIPLDDRRHWLRIPDVICVFVDMTVQLPCARRRPIVRRQEPTNCSATRLFAYLTSSVRRT